jgi:hypothetical protein
MPVPKKSSRSSSAAHLPNHKHHLQGEKLSFAPQIYR